MKTKLLKPMVLSCALLSSVSAQAIDLGIYYTSAFKAAYGNNIDSVRSAIASEIALANSALQQAGSTNTYNIIYISESTITNVTATGAAGALTSNSMSTSDALNSGVDIQVVYFGSNSGNCGAETHNGSGNDRDIANMSYVAVSSNCMGSGTTAHELGHSHGMGHQDGEGGITSYAKAMNCGSASTLVHTGHSLSFYSDPSKTNNEEACGIADEYDNARIARERGTYLENHNSLRRDATVSLASNSYTANEDDNGVSITVNLTNPITDDAYVEAYVIYGSANSSDIQWAPQRIAVPIGVTTFDFTIPVANDSTPEAAETFTVGIRDGVGVSASDTASVTIAESDVVEVVDGNVSFDLASITVVEGQSTTVGLTRTGSTGDAVISFSSESLSYLSNSELTFSPGQSRNLTISIPQDNNAEGNRSFVVNLSHPDPNVVGNPSTLTVNVIEDESTGYIKIPDSAYNGSEYWGVYYYVTEGDTVNLPLERAEGNVGIVSSAVTVNSGDASSVSFPNNITFEDGVDSGILSINIADNNVVDGTKEVTLSFPTGKEFEGKFNGGIYLVISDNDNASTPTDPTPTDPTPTDPTPTDPTPTDPTPTDPTPTDPTPTDPTPTDPTPTDPTPTDPTPTNPTPTNPTIIIDDSVSIVNAPAEVLEGEEFEITLKLNNSTGVSVNATLWYLGESESYELNKNENEIMVTLSAPKDSSTDDVFERITLQGSNNIVAHNLNIKDVDLEGSIQFGESSYNIDVEESESFELSVERTEGKNGMISVTIENLQGEYEDVELLIHDGQMSVSHSYDTIDNDTNDGNKELTFRLINSNTDIVNQDVVSVDVADDENPGQVTFKVENGTAIEREDIAVEILRTGGSSGEIQFYFRESSNVRNSTRTITMLDGVTSKTILMPPLDVESDDVLVRYLISNKNQAKYGNIRGDITAMNITVLNIDIGTVDEPFELTTEQEEGSSTLVAGSDTSFTISRPERVFGDVEFIIYNEELDLEMMVTMLDGESSVDVTFPIPAMYLESDKNIELKVSGVDGTLSGVIPVTVKPLEDKMLDVQSEVQSVEQDRNIVIILNRPEDLLGDVVFTIDIVELGVKDEVRLLDGENVYVYELPTTNVSPQSLTINFEEKSLRQFKGTVSVDVISKPVAVEEPSEESSGGSMGIVAMLLGGVLITRRRS